MISNQTPWRNLSKHNAGWDLPLLNQLDFVESINKLSKLSSKQYKKKRLDALKFVRKRINMSEILESNKDLFY